MVHTGFVIVYGSYRFSKKSKIKRTFIHIFLNKVTVRKTATISSKKEEEKITLTATIYIYLSKVFDTVSFAPVTNRR